MLELLLLAFCAGLIVKAVDWMDDDQSIPHPAKYPLAVLYGALLGYMIAAAPFAMLFLAAIAAQVFAKKVDTTAHRIGLAATMLIVLAIGIPSMDMALFIFFLVAAFLDEIDYIGSLRPLTEWRPFLKLAGFAFVFLGKPEFFLGIIAFDIGYELFRFIAAKPPAQKKARKSPGQ
jgi:hypothetical protein